MIKLGISGVVLSMKKQFFSWILQNDGSFAKPSNYETWEFFAIEIKKVESCFKDWKQN